MEEKLGTILLVEDQDSDAALLRMGFQKAKVLNPILHLKNGDDALLYLEGREHFSDRRAYPLPVLILLDLRLPGLTGFQILQWMRTRNDIRRIPVVVLTMDDARETINTAYDLGANSYLVKPGNATAIARMVSAIRQYWIELNEDPHLVMGAQSS